MTRDYMVELNQARPAERTEPLPSIREEAEGHWTEILRLTVAVLGLIAILVALVYVAGWQAGGQ